MLHHGKVSMYKRHKRLLIEVDAFKGTKERKICVKLIFCPIPGVVHRAICIHGKQSPAKKTDDNSIHYESKLRINDHVSIVTGHVVTYESVANRKQRYRTGSDIFDGTLQTAPRTKNDAQPRAPRPSLIIIINYMRIMDTTVGNSLAISSSCKFLSTTIGPHKYTLSIAF